MFAQLGNIVFDGLFGFSDLRFDGQQASYAEFALFNRKPTIQKVATSLLQITASVTLHVDFCNIEEKLTALQDYRNSGQVLPLLMGNGLLIGNFVVTDTPFSVDVAFPDGTFQQISIDLTLKESVNYSAGEMQQQAIALGKKKPVVIKPVQKSSQERQILEIVLFVRQLSAKINAGVLDGQANPLLFWPNGANNIKNIAEKGLRISFILIDQLNKAPEVKNANPKLQPAAIIVKQNFNDIFAVPLITVAEAINKNTVLQANTRKLTGAAAALTQKVTSRR